MIIEFVTLILRDSMPHAGNNVILVSLSIPQMTFDKEIEDAVIKEYNSSHNILPLLDIISLFILN